MRIAAALTVLLLAGSAWSALDYSRFAHPAGDYALEYPSDWKTSYGLQALFLQPPERTASSVRIAVERYPVGAGSPPTPAAYIKALLEPVGRTKKLDSRQTRLVSGVKAQRIALTETAALKGSYGQTLPGPMREVRLIVPQGKSYYVVSLTGVGPAFEAALPEFERLCGTLRLKPGRR